MQYFDRPHFYQETQRVLCPQGGVIAIFENNRDWQKSAFLAAYEDWLKKNVQSPKQAPYSRSYRKYPFLDELQTEFHDAQEHQISWST